MADQEITVQDNADRRRFEIAVDDAFAGELQYVDVDGRRVFTHIEVGEDFAGMGLARSLTRQSLDSTRGAGMRIVVVCPYVKSFLDKTDEYDAEVDAASPDLVSAAEADRATR